MKKIFLILGTVVVLAVGLFVARFFMGGETPDIADPSGLVFFYGRECPHCKVVESFISQNKIDDKLKFSWGEVYHNKKNVEIFKEKYKECGVKDENKMGVPMLFDKGKCYVGENEIVDYFKKAINSK